MRVFVTGASGWIGSAAVDELLAAGHEVTGLARSDASAAALEAKGVRVRRGDLDDLDSIRAGAAGRRRRHPSGQQARLRRTRPSRTRPSAPPCRPSATRWPAAGRPFLLASGVAGLSRGPARPPRTTRRRSTARTRRAAAARTSRSSSSTVASTRVSLRFAPTVHGVGDHGFIAAIAGVAREKGVSGYPGDGTNRWAAVHRLRRRAAGRARPRRRRPRGARLHAVAEEGIPTREIAEAIGRAFDLPVASVDPDDVQDHFGWIGGFFAMEPHGDQRPRRASCSAGRPPGRPSSRTSTRARTGAVAAERLTCWIMGRGRRGWCRCGRSG